MKKVLMIAAATAALMSADAGAFGKGFHTGATVGYSYNTAQVNTRADADTSKGKSSAFNGGIFVGFDKMVNTNWMFDTRFALSYDSASVTVSKATEGAALAKLAYTPQIGLGLSGHFGRMLNDKIAGYVGLGLEYNFAKLKLTGTDITNQKDSIKVWSITPTLGVKGAINDKMSWLAELSYKMAISVKKKNVSIVETFKTKPRAFVAKVGVSYHF